MKTKKRKVCHKCNGSTTIYDPPDEIKYLFVSQEQAKPYIKVCPTCNGTGERNKHNGI